MHRFCLSALLVACQCICSSGRVLSGQHVETRRQLIDSRGLEHCQINEPEAYQVHLYPFEKRMLRACTRQSIFWLVQGTEQISGCRSDLQRARDQTLLGTARRRRSEIILTTPLSEGQVSLSLLCRRYRSSGDDFHVNKSQPPYVCNLCMPFLPIDWQLGCVIAGFGKSTHKTVSFPQFGYKIYYKPFMLSFECCLVHVSAGLQQCAFAAPHS